MITQERLDRQKAEYRRQLQNGRPPVRSPRPAEAKQSRKAGNELVKLIRQRFAADCSRCFHATLRDMNAAEPETIYRNAESWAKALYENAKEAAAQGRETAKTLLDWADYKTHGWARYEELIAEACRNAAPGEILDADIVIDSNRHGFGDAILFSWVAEGAKKQGVKIAHYATNQMADLLRCFGQEIVSRPTEGMLNINEAYFAELRAHGKLSALYNRCKWLGVDEPVRPETVSTANDIDQWAKQVIEYPAVLLFPQATRRLRVWPKNYWIFLCSDIRERGLQPIVCTWGSDAESWRQHVPYLQVDLLWSEVVGLMKHAKAAIGNNSGPIHVSGTVGLPSFVISGLTTETSLEGIPELIHVSVEPDECPCVGCYFASPPRQPACELGCLALQSLTPKKVIAVLDDYYRRS